MKLKKCNSCKKYTLKNICENCKKKTSDAHYKFREGVFKILN